MSKLPFYEVAHNLNRLISEYELSKLKSVIPSSLKSISFAVRLEYDDDRYYCSVFPELDFDAEEDNENIFNIFDHFYSLDVDLEIIQQYYGADIYAEDIYSAATDNVNLRAVDILLDGIGKSIKLLNSHEKIAVIERLQAQLDEAISSPHCPTGTVRASCGV